MKSRVAVCLAGELRGVNSCLPTLFKHVLEPLKAGVFYCFNKHSEYNDQKVNIFNNRLVSGRIYDKTNLKIGRAHV